MKGIRILHEPNRIAGTMKLLREVINQLKQIIRERRLTIALLEKKLPREDRMKFP